MTRPLTLCALSRRILFTVCGLDSAWAAAGHKNFRCARNASHTKTFARLYNAAALLEQAGELNSLTLRATLVKAVYIVGNVLTLITSMRVRLERVGFGFC